MFSHEAAHHTESACQHQKGWSFPSDRWRVGSKENPIQQLCQCSYARGVDKVTLLQEEGGVFLLLLLGHISLEETPEINPKSFGRNTDLTLNCKLQRFHHMTADRTGPKTGVVGAEGGCVRRARP